MEDPYTWRVGGDHGVPGSFTNDAMIQEALREREMPDSLAGLMMSPDAPQSREDILADMALRNSLEFGETNDPFAGLDFDPGNPMSNLDSLAEDPMSGAMPSSEYPPVMQDLIFEDMDPGMMQAQGYDPMADFDVDMGTGREARRNRLVREDQARILAEAMGQPYDSMADFDVDMGTGRDSQKYPPVMQDLIFEDMDPGMMEREYPSVLQDLIFEDMDPGMMEREYPPVMQDLIFEDMDPGMMQEQGERSPVLRTMDQLDPEEMEIYNMIMQSDAPDQMKYQMYTQLLSRSYGGAIPGYGIGGFLKKALTTVAGGIHPALGAGVGGIASLFDDPGEGGSRTKNFFKSALAGGLGGIGTSNILKGGLGGLKDFKALAGDGKLTGFDKLKSLASNVGRGLGEGVDNSIEAYSDPKILGLAAPIMGQLMDKSEGTPQAQNNQDIFDNTSSAVVGGSANPANWQNGQYMGNAQGDSMEALKEKASGGYLSGYENGGEYGDEYNEPTYYRPPQRKKKVAKQPKPKLEQWQLPPDPSLMGGDEPVINQVRNAVPNTAAAAPWQLPPDPSLTGGDASTDASSAAAAEAAAEAINAKQRQEAADYAMRNKDYSNLSFEEEVARQKKEKQTEAKQELIATNQLDPDDKGEQVNEIGEPDEQENFTIDDQQAQAKKKASDVTPSGKFDHSTGKVTKNQEYIDANTQYMGEHYGQGSSSAANQAPVAPVAPGPAAGSTANNQNYVAGWQPETSAATGENAVNPVGLNPMKTQDQSALSTQQQDFIARMGKAEGGELALREPPQQIRSIVKKALNGELSSAQVNVEKVLSEINATYPGLIEEVANEIRAERQQQGGGPPVVREGYIPPFNDGMPESSGRVDDRAAAVLPSSDTGISAGLERSLAKGGKIPMGAVVAPHEYILDKEDTAENITNLKAAVNYVAKRNPRAKGPQMWDATRKHMDIGRVKNA